jgi:hypothetical protein
MASDTSDTTQPDEHGRQDDTAGTAASSTVKDPSDWATGGEPATGAQMSYLETLARDSGAEVPGEVTKAEASQLIDELREQSPRVGESGSGEGQQ